MSKGPELPRYQAEQFGSPALECDAIMKGGVTSGIVYPYAILEIATRYRFRSLGGTSAGAIAAAFAAAAEYARSIRGDPSGFVRLQRYCDQLPSILLSLFQPDRDFDAAIKLGKRAVDEGHWIVLGRLAATSVLASLIAAFAAMWLVPFPPEQPLTRWLGAALVAVLALAVALAGSFYLQAYRPIARAYRSLVSNGFGACSGLTVPGSKYPGLTDWLHEAMQDIAFGCRHHPDPLTFRHLEECPPGVPPIDLRMVTTNISMGRPHTLPDLGISAGFNPAQWAKLFPPAVMKYLTRVSGPWRGVAGAMRVPQGKDLPVICAVRMSLSFPVLFKAVPILVIDHEFSSVIKALGGTAKRRMVHAWLTDGGLSSNFPIHLFDSPLPTRPTFAISLDQLQCPAAAVQSRVLLPDTASEGGSVQVKEINTLVGFGWGMLTAAKDWQDQLASGVTGQRERIARIFLDRREGGLNLNMPAHVSKALMSYGLDAGRLFTTRFDFDEHRWRRMLSVYRNTEEWMDRATTAWTGGYAVWFQGYQGRVGSYRSLALGERKLIAKHFDDLASATVTRTKITRATAKFPARTGQLRVAGRY